MINFIIGITMLGMSVGIWEFAVSNLFGDWLISPDDDAIKGLSLVVVSFASVLTPFFGMLILASAKV